MPQCGIAILGEAGSLRSPPMAIDYSRSAPATAPTSITRHLGLLLLRFTAGGSLLFWYGGRQAITGWNHIWHKTPWALPGQLAGLGFPLSLTVSIFLVILTILGSTFIMLGLLTRLSAIAMGVVAAVTALLFTAYPEIEEQALLYTGLCFAISLCGAGPFAVDKLLRSSTSRRP